MEPTRASQTAIDTAHVRALDTELLQPPVFGDAFAARLLTPDEREAREAPAIEAVERQSPELKDQARDTLLRTALCRNASVVSLVLGRARYGEDRLSEAIQAGVTQYVIIGAGLDSFALRHPGLCDRLNVFEVDHPQSQSDKQVRIREAGLAMPANVQFGACDFESESIEAALAALPYDPQAPAFFAWMGVTMYLSPAALDAALRSLRAVAKAGGEVVFDYLDAGAMATHSGTESVRSNVERVRKLGEPVRGAIAGDFLARKMPALGFELIEDLDPDEQEARYFSARTDGLHASEVGRIACYRIV